MSRLLLLRHAKAAWAKPGARDFDRPLEYSGQVDALAAGIAMATAGRAPDLVLCSTALRARETWARVSQAFSEMGERVSYIGDLYSADAAGYLEIIHKAPDAGCVLVVGHNPMMEDLAEALSGDGDARARATLSSGFPTCGLAVIAFEGSLSAAAPGTGYLERFLVR